MSFGYNFLNLNDSCRIDENVVAKRRYGRFTIKDSRPWRLKMNGKNLPIYWVENLSPKGLQLRVCCREKVDVGDYLEIELRLKGEDFFKCRAIVRWKALSNDSVNMVTLGLEFAGQTNQPQYAWQPSENLNEFLESVKVTRPGSQWPPLWLQFSGVEIFMACFLPLVLGIISQFY